MEIGVVTHDAHYTRLQLTFSAYGITQLHQVPVEYELTAEEQRKERIFYLMHRYDPKGIIFGNLFTTYVRAQKALGGGRKP
jgi:hypothetical protein